MQRRPPIVGLGYRVLTLLGASKVHVFLFRGGCIRWNTPIVVLSWCTHDVLSEETSNFHVSLPRCHVVWSRPVVGSGCHVCAMLDEETCHFHTTTRRCTMQ